MAINPDPMTRLPSEDEEFIEEGLSEILECFENKLTTRDQVEPVLSTKVKPGILKTLENEGFVSTPDGRVVLSREGEALALSVIRRKRLAERLLKDVLNVKEEYINPAACQWEHTLSKEVTNSICTLLGHPSHSPMELPIPPGDCCKTEARSPAPVIRSLDALPRGAKAKVIYLLSKQHPELNRLLSMGLMPGSTIDVVQKFPTFVIEVGETQLAFDEGIASGIFVHPL